MDPKKRTWAEVDLGAIERNVRAMREKLPAGCRFLGVVKADGYGHGSVPVAKRLEKCGCEYLAVACLDELETLRAGGITLPVLILGFTPAQYASDLLRLNATQAVGKLAYAKELSAAAEAEGKKLKVHLKLETGMGRTGFRAYGEDELDAAAEAVNLPGLDAEGVFTHFCVSDCDAPVKDFTEEQFARFKAGFAAVEEKSGKKFVIHHCTNSGAMISFPGTYSDMVRPGVATYGMYPGNDRGDIQLEPAMSLYSHVYCVEKHYPGDTISYGRTFTVEKESEIAVIPVGYADGFHRVQSNKAEFFINGQRVKQVGRICMDMCMADVTGLGVKPGDVVELFGKNISVNEIAEHAGTINYEITCALTPRVPRVYID